MKPSLLLLLPLLALLLATTWVTAKDQETEDDGRSREVQHAQIHSRRSLLPEAHSGLDKSSNSIGEIDAGFDVQGGGHHGHYGHDSGHRGGHGGYGGGHKHHDGDGDRDTDAGRKTMEEDQKKAATQHYGWGQPGHGGGGHGDYGRGHGGYGGGHGGGGRGGYHGGHGGHRRGHW